MVFAFGLIKLVYKKTTSNANKFYCLYKAELCNIIHLFFAILIFYPKPV